MPLEEVPEDKQANLEATVRRAVALGINHIESLDLSGVLKNSPFAKEIPGWLKEAHEMLYEARKKRLSEGET